MSTTIVTTLINDWQAAMGKIPAAQFSMDFLTPAEGAGFLLWANEGDPHMAAAEVARCVALCPGYRYPFWSAVRSILKNLEAN